MGEQVGLALNTSGGARFETCQDIVLTVVCVVLLSPYRHYLKLGHERSVTLPFQLVIYYHLVIRWCVASTSHSIPKYTTNEKTKK
jgi:hypothetical protein